MGHAQMRESIINNVPYVCGCEDRRKSKWVESKWFIVLCFGPFGRMKEKREWKDEAITQ